MNYGRKGRRRQIKPSFQDSLISGVHLRRLFTSGFLLLAVVLIAAMGLLFTSTQAKTDLTNCPCLSEIHRGKPDDPVVPIKLRELPPKSPLAGKPSLWMNERVFKGTAEVPNKFKPNWWKEYTRNVCEDLGLSTNQSELKPAMLSKVLVDDMHKILYCQVAKVASTNLGKVFTIITGMFNGTDLDAINTTDIHFKYNKLFTHLNSVSYEELMDKLKKYFKFIFVRDPFERLLSGYRNKFLIPSTQYFANLNKRIIFNYRTNKSNHGVITFPEFVTYLVDEERQIPVNAHWQPMYQICRPCEVNYDFIGKLNSFGDDIHYIFKVNNLTNLITLPKKTSSHSFHRTDLYVKEFYSQVPKELMLRLYRMYYPDYAIFDYEVPGVILEMLK